MTALPKDGVADLRRRIAELEQQLQSTVAERDEAIAQQAATADVLQVINSSPADLAPVFEAILDKALQPCDAQIGVLWTYDGKSMHASAIRGAPPAYVEFLRRGPHRPSHVQVRLLAGNEGFVQVADLLHSEGYRIGDSLPRAAADLGGIRTLLVVPLRKHGAVLGTFGIYRQEVKPFSDRQIALVESFAAQAVIAMENARLFNETKEALERQTATADILKVIASSPSNVQPVFDAIARRANTLVGGFSSTVFRFIDGIAYLKAFTPTTPAADEILKATFPRPVADFPPFRMAQAGEVTQVPDTEALSDEILEISRARGFRSMLFAPLMHDGTSIGFIAVTRVQPGNFADHHVQLLQTFADQAVIAIENARLFEEVQAKTRDLTESLQQQTATADVLKVISRSAFDLQAALHTLVESAARLCAADQGTITRQKDGKFYRAESFGHSREFMDYVRDIPVVVDRGSASGRALLEGVLVHIADVQADPEYTFNEAQRLGGYRTCLGVPILREGVPVGVLSLTRSEVRPFTDKQIELVTMFADQAAIAIENARLFEEVQAKTGELTEALTYQTGSSNILSVIASSPTDVAPVLKAIVESAGELCDAYDAIVLLKDGDELRYSAHHGPIPNNLEKWPINRNWTAGRAFLDQKPVHVRDLLSDEGTDFPDARELSQQQTGSLGIRTLLSVPLLREHESIGAILLRRIEVHPFSEKQIALLQTFADQAVIAIGNVHLFEEVQARTEDLRESLDFQTASSDVLKVISSSPDTLQPVLDVIVETSRHLCGTETSTIFLLKDDKFHIAAASGAMPEYLEFLRNNPIALDQAGSSTSRAAREKRTVHIPDIGADPEFGQGPMAVGQRRALLSVPLMREGTAIGVITMRQSHLTPFTERQIEVVQTFADQAVIAISNVRLFEEVQAKTRDLTEALTYQTGSANILRVIASSPTDVGPVLKAIVESACELCDAYDAIVLLKEGDELRFNAHHGPIPLDMEKWPINRNWTPGRALVDRKPVHVHDMHSVEGNDFPEGREMSLRQGQRTVLSVPLLREGEGIGAIVLRRTEVHPFSDKQIALLQTFADQAVIAIGNVRLFEEVQAKTHDLTEALTYQTGSSKILSVIASSPTDVGPVLKAIVESACELCDAYDALVRLKDGDDLVLSAHHGPIPTNLDKVPINYDWTAGRAFLDQKPVHVHDLLSTEGDQFPEAQGLSRFEADHRTILSVPLLRENESIGAIVLRRTEVHPFSDKQIALLQTFADQAVIAIGNVRLFEQVQERTRELSKSLDDLRTAQDRLIQTEKLASLGQLTAGIAHEIKNPLNFVNNFSALSAELTDELNDVLKKATLADKVRVEVDELTGLLKDNLQKVVQHGKRADSIVKNMLLHSREGSGEHRPADINALVDESLNLAYHGARAEKPQFNVTLQRNFDPNAGLIDVFPQEITRVFLNLISNGFYAVTKRKADNGAGFDPVVSATTRDRGDHVEIRIRDNGTGIPPHVKEKMFNPFFTTKPAGEGTGLGLSMSHDIIVKQHGGTIDVVTEPGQFTEFTVVLPRTSNLSNKTRG
jgi:GAF domain-containing protein